MDEFQCKVRCPEKVRRCMFSLNSISPHLNKTRGSEFNNSSEGNAALYYYCNSFPKYFRIIHLSVCLSIYLFLYLPTPPTLPTYLPTSVFRRDDSEVVCGEMVRARHGSSGFNLRIPENHRRK